MPVVTDRRRHLDIEGTLTLPASYTFGHLPTVSKTPARFFAVQQGKVFRAVPCQAYSAEEWETWPPSWGWLHGPVAPGTTLEDVQGATYAYDDGTYWHFAHCSPAEQHDFAADAQAWVADQLRADTEDSTFDAIMAQDLATRTAALYKAKALAMFGRACGRWAHTYVLGKTLGFFHREPHHDHKRDLAVAALDAVLADWQEQGKTDNAIDLSYQRVKAAAATIRARLVKTATIEWRAARQARLERAAAARGDDPVAGYEYCYTLKRRGDAITGTADLPDPTWNFDSFPPSGILRGYYTYEDSEPETNSFFTWVVRFRRPIPAGTKAGADIGSVAWEQETAYHP